MVGERGKGKVESFYESGRRGISNPHSPYGKETQKKKKEDQIVSPLEVGGIGRSHLLRLQRLKKTSEREGESVQPDGIRLGKEV